MHVLRYLFIFLTCLQVHDKVLQFLIFKIRKKNMFFFQNFPLPPTNENFWYFVQLLWTLTTKIFFGRPENLWTVIKLYCTCFEVSFYIFNMPTSTRQSFTIFNFQDPKKKYFFFKIFHKWKFLIFFSVFVNFDDQNIFWKTWKSMNSNGNVLYMLWGIFLYF